MLCQQICPKRLSFRLPRFYRRGLVSFWLLGNQLSEHYIHLVGSFFDVLITPLQKKTPGSFHCYKITNRNTCVVFEYLPTLRLCIQAFKLTSFWAGKILIQNIKEEKFHQNHNQTTISILQKVSKKQSNPELFSESSYHLVKGSNIVFSVFHLL